MREFSSGQIKKGVRSIGFGGDGATWGNYALVAADANTALVDYGDTHFTNGNNFNFEAVGLNSPSLWHGLTIYVVAMFQGTNGVSFSAKSPGLGSGPVSLSGRGSDQGIFAKIAMPLGKGFSIGVLLDHETSQFDASTAGSSNPQQVRYETLWRPSGGLGITWQSKNKKMLFGIRGLSNNDMERRTDPAGITDGMARTTEFRMGGSVSPWESALIDIGATRLERWNGLGATHTVFYDPNLGFEQGLLSKRLTLRAGLDETSPTAGLSLKFARYKLDAAYVHDMGESRVGDLFGANSQSVVFTFTVDYGRAK